MASFLIGYPLTKYTIRPFADYDLTNDAQEAQRRQGWNQKLSSIRISVEHAFGMLKGRFPFLRHIPNYDIDHVYHIIEALLIVHNFLIDRSDDPEQIYQYHGGEDRAVIEWRNERRGGGGRGGDRMSNDDLYRSGLLRRKWLLNRYR